MDFIPEKKSTNTNILYTHTQKFLSYFFLLSLSQCVCDDFYSKYLYILISYTHTLWWWIFFFFFLLFKFNRKSFDRFELLLILFLLNLFAQNNCLLSIPKKKKIRCCWMYMVNNFILSIHPSIYVWRTTKGN